MTSLDRLTIAPIARTEISKKNIHLCTTMPSTTQQHHPHIKPTGNEEH